MAYRDDLAALAARHDALEHEVAHKTRELVQATQVLEQARARLKLPVLDNLRVASPCSADWAQMTGDDRARHCAACDKNVYNVTGMAREEAEALILAKEGRLCVRYYQRADGTILLADCTVGKKRARRRWLVGAGVAGLLTGAAAILTGDLPERAQAIEDEGQWVAGLMAEPAPPPPQVDPPPADPAQRSGLD
jgi:hypothetical protein